MEAKVVIFSLFVATILAVSSSHANLIADQSDDIFMPEYSGVDSGRSAGLAAVNCLSWRFNVEVDNIQKFKTIPEICRDYIAKYMTKSQYDVDCKVATDTASNYALTIPVPLPYPFFRRDVWVFDIGQTALSFLDYYAQPDVDYGAIEYNSTKFDEWYSNAIVPANPRVLKLYQKLVSLDFKIVFISGTKESQREKTEANLNSAGYTTWEKLILKKESEADLTAEEFKAKKRTELVNQGYIIRGNMGDQWSDLNEPNEGDRVFKLPNPMFYIA